MKASQKILATLLTLGITLTGASLRAQTTVSSDIDHDGVLDARDACPRTPAGAAPVALGCSAAELVHAPETVTAPVLARLEERRTAFGQEETAYADAVHSLDSGRAQIEAAAAQLRQGQVCEAESTYEAAQADLRYALDLLSRATEEEAAALLESRIAGADVHESEVQAALRRLREELTRQAVTDAGTAGETFHQLCGQVAGGIEVSGKVTDVNDASGLVRMESGEVYALAAGAHATPPYAGGTITARGLGFADGTGVLTDVTASGIVSARSLATAKSGSCLELRIAPFQRFPPFFAGPYLLHGTTGYIDVDGVLALERGQRFAVVDTGCPTSGNWLSQWYYGMKIEVTGGAPAQVLAADLRQGDDPVSLPSQLNSTVILKATTFRTKCSTFGCATPELIASQTFAIRIRPLGYYATAIYSKLVFGVADNGVANDFETVKVTSLGLGGGINAANSPQLVADGYKVVNGVSSKPQTQLIGLNQLFAIYEDDFYDPDGFLQMEFTGVDRPSGLKWPRVTGTRSGAPFQYSVKLPTIVRDRIAVCSGEPDTFYDLPFASGWPTWTVGSGNWDDPLNAHGGVQKFAIDFMAPANTDIHAARGGKVTFVVENESLNVTEYPPGYTGMGNYMFIEHQDGTYGVYFHMVQNGVLVNVGDRVHRGDHIAEVGNTGNSSDNHLHFESGKQCPWQQCPNLPNYDTVDIRYDAKVGSQAQPVSWQVDTCHLPRVGEKLFFH